MTEELAENEDEDVPAERSEWPEDPAERVRLLVEAFLDELDLEGEVEVEEGGDSITASVEGDDDYGVLIGRRGQTIDALQLICYQAAFRGVRDRKRVTVDAAGYRAERDEMLEGRADRAADDAIATGDEIEMDPMNARERRVVHERLRDRPEVETFSAGDEPNRRVVVAPLVTDGAGWCRPARREPAGESPTRPHGWSLRSRR
ncbi:MAG: protein jag [Solirubrobacterales bacterium]